MAAADFDPVIRAAELLGPFGLAVILILCWVVFPAFLYFHDRKTEPPINRTIGLNARWEMWLIQPTMFLVMWYVLATIVDQVRHGPYEFASIWPSSFAAAALFASNVLILGFRETRGIRWFLLVGFLICTSLFGLFFQFLSWFFPRYLTFLLGAS